jgi:hypothetical protein
MERDPFAALFAMAKKNMKPMSPNARAKHQANAKARLNAAKAAYNKRERVLVAMAREYNKAAAKLRLVVKNVVRSASPRTRTPSPRRVRVGVQPPVFVTTKNKNGKVTRQVFYRTGKGFYEVGPNGKINYSKRVNRK